MGGRLQRLGRQVDVDVHGRAGRRRDVRELVEAAAEGGDGGLDGERHGGRGEGWMDGMDGMRREEKRTKNETIE